MRIKNINFVFFPNVGDLKKQATGSNRFIVAGTRFRKIATVVIPNS
jgi:hypothetical protein